MGVLRVPLPSLWHVIIVIKVSPTTFPFISFTTSLCPHILSPSPPSVLTFCFWNIRKSYNWWRPEQTRGKAWKSLGSEVCVFRAWVLRSFLGSFWVCCSEYELRQQRENVCRRESDLGGYPYCKKLGFWQVLFCCAKPQLGQVGGHGGHCLLLSWASRLQGVRKTLVNGWDSVIGWCYGMYWASLVAQLVKNEPAVWETWVRSLGWENPLKKGKAIHSNILDQRIPCTV